MACGATLVAPEPAREARKVVTVVFADITGSTGLGERLDPETLRSIMGRWFDAMQAVLERHDGSVEKFIGDAVVAVFGVPVVHEDDALRACRAAVEMRDALPDLGVEGRIGVNTGEVLAGTEERLATGDAVNVAARLEQSADPGEVLIGASTLALVRQAVVVESVEAVDGIDARVVRGRCLPYGEGITYWPVVEVVKQLDAVPSDEEAAAALRSLLGEAHIAASGDDIAWGFRKLLEERAPLIVVFD